MFFCGLVYVLSCFSQFMLIMLLQKRHLFTHMNLISIYFHLDLFLQFTFCINFYYQMYFQWGDINFRQFKDSAGVSLCCKGEEKIISSICCRGCSKVCRELCVLKGKETLFSETYFFLWVLLLGDQLGIKDIFLQKIWFQEVYRPRWLLILQFLPWFLEWTWYVWTYFLIWQ